MFFNTGFNNFQPTLSNESLSSQLHIIIFSSLLKLTQYIFTITISYDATCSLYYCNSFYVPSFNSKSTIVVYFNRIIAIDPIR